MWKWKCLEDYDEYHLPGNVKPYGYNSDFDMKIEALRHVHTRTLSHELDWDPDLEGANGAAAEPSEVMAASPGEPSASYIAATRGSSSSSSFTKTAGRMTYSMSNDVDAVNAARAVETAYDPVAQHMAARGPEPDAAADITLPKRSRAASYMSITGTGKARRISYNHTVDPSYEEYVRGQTQQKGKARASRASSFTSSVGTSATPPTTAPASRVTSDSAAVDKTTAAYRLSLKLKNDVDGAVGAGFGWGAATRTSIDSVSGGAPSNPRKSVRDSLSRAPSNASDHGTMGNVSDCSEDEEEEDEEDLRSRRRENVDQASRALLGGGADEDVGHPEMLRPGRPKSAVIEFVVTPPPKSPGKSSRLTWGGAYSSS